MRTKDRAEPQPTDLDEKLIALRRRTASRSQKLPQQDTPVVVVTQPKNAEVSVEDDFSRRLKISGSPSSSKLFHLERDPIPRRLPTAEPEAMSESSSHAPRSSHPRPSRHHQQLFDHRKDDPVRFSVLARPPSRPAPTPKSSGDYISASSNSSYAASQASSTFTLSSTTDGSSASSALFDGHGHSKPTPSEEAGQNVFAAQLKRLYRTITNLENQIKKEHEVKADDDDGDNDMAGPVGGRILLRGRDAGVQPVPEAPSEEEAEKEKWKKQIGDHKRLVDTIHNLLEISLAPSVPASLRSIPTKYNIIVRLWTYGFYKLLESLRRASFSSPLALEHLQDFIYYAYIFYTGILEEPQLASFRSGWLEALGDLALYKMAVVALVDGSERSPTALTLENLSRALTDSADTLAPPTQDAQAKSNLSEAPAARIDDSPSPSIGPAAAKLLGLEPEKERWRSIARDWYGKGLADQPGTGKLHHHLGLLSRDLEGDELRGVYHYVKSLTTTHPFSTSRESILSLFSQPSQAKRLLPDSNSSDLFVLLHGMMFTNINLDDFTPTLARFMERLTMEESAIEERTWVMMAVVNIAAVLEYGKPAGVLRKLGGGVQTAGPTGATRFIAKREPDAERMDVDGSPIIIKQSPAMSSPSVHASGDPPYTPAFTNALTITFTMLSHVLKCPTRKTSPFAKSTVNPYLTVLLTFLNTILKQPGVCDVIERWVPWDDLRTFFSGGWGRGKEVPTSIWVSQGLVQHPSAPSGKHPRSREETWLMLTSSTAPPLPEDWCLRGMEWVGRKVYERGFWKVGEEKSMEGEFLDESEVGLGDDGTDGRIESDDDDDKATPSKASDSKDEINAKRWIRLLRSAIGISNIVEGFSWVEGTKQFVIEGALKEKVAAWKEQERFAREEDERRRRRRDWDDDEDDDMDIDDDVRADSSEGSDEDDTDEIKELKARRKYLESILQSSSMQSRRRRRGGHDDNRALLPIMAGYTVLVVDTNILLSFLPRISSLVESHRWTIVVPLPVIMELDGLCSNPSEISHAAKDAVAFMASHIRTHSMSLKVLTSKGNYLNSLSVRAEEVSFGGSSGRGDVERNMDDLILKAAIWQNEFWVDRSAMLRSGDRMEVSDPIRVVLLTLDRNLRLKARSRELPAASEKDLATLLTATGT